MRSEPRPRGRRGFTLIEMVVVVQFLGLFLVLAAHLFTGINRLQRGLQEREAALQRWDSALHALRDDLWNAEGFAASPADLEIESQAGACRWRWEDGAASLVRTAKSAEGEAERRWGPMARPPAWEARGPALLLRIPAGVPGAAAATGKPMGAGPPHTSGDGEGETAEVCLVSQVMLAREVRP